MCYNHLNGNKEISKINRERKQSGDIKPIFISEKEAKPNEKESVNQKIYDTLTNFAFLVSINGKDQGYGYAVRFLEVKLGRSLKKDYEKITGRLYDYKIKLIEINKQFPLGGSIYSERKDILDKLKKETIRKIKDVIN